jgi:hypothetical protein
MTTVGEEYEFKLDALRNKYRLAIHKSNKPIREMFITALQYGESLQLWEEETKSKLTQALLEHTKAVEELEKEFKQALCESLGRVGHQLWEEFYQACVEYLNGYGTYQEIEELACTFGFLLIRC